MLGHAAIGLRHNRARYRHQQRADIVEGEVEHRRRRQIFIGDLKQRHRHRRGVEAENHWRRNIRRQRLDDGLRNRDDFSLGRRNVALRLEINLDDADAVVGVAFDMVEALDRRGQLAFVIEGDAARHVLRQKTGIGPDHRDDRNTNIREHVGRRFEDRHDPVEQNRDGQNDEGVRPLERDDDDGVHDVCCSTILAALLLNEHPGRVMRTLRRS